MTQDAESGEAGGAESEQARPLTLEVIEGSASSIIPDASVSPMR